MKIVVFSELLYPHGGGAELATWLYANMLGIRGFEVTIVTRQFSDEAQLETLKSGLTVYRIPMSIAAGTRYNTLLNGLAWFNGLANRLIEKSDVVYIPSSWFSVIPLAKARKKPIVVHQHNYSMACPASVMYNFAEGRIGPSSGKSFIIHEICERRRKLPAVVLSSLVNELFGKYYGRLTMFADALIFVSRAQMDLTLSRIRFNRKKSHVIHNPIRTVPLINAKEKGVSYFGGASYVKGFYVLMRALRSLAQTSIVAYIAMTSESSRVERVGKGILVNLLPKIDPRSIMSRTSIVVIPSLFPEPSPYVLFESMLYGKLVIASDLGGIPEIVCDVGSGVKLVKPGNDKEIAAEMLSFQDFELEEINEVGARNREFILRKFDNERSLQSFIEVLHEVAT